MTIKVENNKNVSLTDAFFSLTIDPFFDDVLEVLDRVEWNSRRVKKNPQKKGFETYHLGEIILRFNSRSTEIPNDAEMMARMKIACQKHNNKPIVRFLSWIIPTFIFQFLGLKFLAPYPLPICVNPVGQKQAKKNETILSVLPIEPIINEPIIKPANEPTKEPIIDPPANKIFQEEDGILTQALLAPLPLTANGSRFMVRALSNFPPDPDDPHLQTCISYDAQEISLRHFRLKELPPELALCKNIKKLDLENNSLTTLPESFADDHPDLEVLELGHNPFTEIPSVIFKLKNLKSLSFHGTEDAETSTTLDYQKLSIQIKNNFKHLTKLETLAINYCGLSTLGFTIKPRLKKSNPTLTQIDV